MRDTLKMPYRYLEKFATADTAFEAWGRTAEEAFVAADVKAVTLHRFLVEETREGWQASVLLDI